MLWAVIMAGGSGTRFWPESRKKNPKQFLKIFGKRTLLEETVLRLGKVIPPERVLVICQNEKVVQARKLLKKVPPAQIFGEPVGRNTAPCAVLAAALARKKDSEAVIALLPADHLIEKTAHFQKALQTAGKIAAKEKLPVTFGMKPKFAHTGFGYLEMERKYGRENSFDVFYLKRFHEKPDAPKAEKFLKAGNFLWNSGMFVWSADALIKAAEKYLPESVAIIDKIFRMPFERGMKKFYGSMQNISIDYGLMEKIQGGILTIPLDMGWNDVGGWQSLEEIWPLDQGRNVSVGKTLLLESEGNIVKSQGRLVALLGVKDFCVVETADAILVCPKSKTESIRKIVEALKDKKFSQYL